MTTPPEEADETLVRDLAVQPALVTVVHNTECLAVDVGHEA
jgi:hypothetical protein